MQKSRHTLEISHTSIHPAQPPLHHAEQDRKRYLDIVKGKVRRDLQKYIEQAELTGKQGKNLVKIPMPNIGLPHIRHNSRQIGGVSQGDGKIGQPVGRSDNPNANTGEAGTDPGEHFVMTLEDYAQFLITELNLHLPLLQPLTRKELLEKMFKVGGKTSQDTPLFHGRGSYLNAVSRIVTYNADGTVNQASLLNALTRIKDRGVRKNKQIKEIDKPCTNAVLIMVRDVSGSMTQEKIEALKIANLSTEILLKKTYQKVEFVYIVHDTDAKVVTKDEYYGLTTSGGTKISAGYEAVAQVLGVRLPNAKEIRVPQIYSPDDWNVYVLAGGDAENIGSDNTYCEQLIKEILLPVTRLTDYIYTPGKQNNMFSLPFIQMYEKLVRETPKLEGVLRAQFAQFVLGDTNFGLVKTLQKLYGEERK